MSSSPLRCPNSSPARLLSTHELLQTRFVASRCSCLPFSTPLSLLLESGFGSSRSGVGGLGICASSSQDMAAARPSGAQPHSEHRRDPGPLIPAARQPHWRCHRASFSVLEPGRPMNLKPLLWNKPASTLQPVWLPYRSPYLYDTLSLPLSTCRVSSPGMKIIRRWIDT